MSQPRGPSMYEVQREANICRNNNYLRTLGISSSSDNRKQEKVHTCQYCGVYTSKNRKSVNSHIGSCRVAIQEKTILQETARTSGRKRNNEFHPFEMANSYPTTRNKGDGDWEQISQGNIDALIDVGHDSVDAEYDNADDMDFNMMLESANDNCSDETQSPSKNPSKIVIMCQENIQNEYFSQNDDKYVPPFNVRNSNGIVNCRWEDYSDLIQMELLTNISRDDGDRILGMFNGILKRHKLSNILQFPSQWRTIHDAANSRSEKFCKVIKNEMKLDIDFFGANDKSGVPLQRATAVNFLLHEIIAHRVLLAKNELQLTPNSEIAMRNGEVVNNSFFTGEYFLEEFKKLIETKGERNHLNQRNVLMVIVVSEDEAAVNSTRSKSMEPCVAEFSCFVGTDQEVDLLGFSALKLPESKEFYNEHLKRIQKCNGKGQRQTIIAMENRRLKQEYLKCLFNPFLKETSQNGFELQMCLPTADVPNPEICCVYCHIGCLSGDNKSLDAWAGVASNRTGVAKQTKCRCRCCTEFDCGRFTPETKKWKIRNHFDMKALSVLGLQAMRRQVLNNLGSRNSKRLSTEDTQILETMNAYNIIPGNCWYDLLEYRIQSKVVLLSDEQAISPASVLSSVEPAVPQLLTGPQLLTDIDFRNLMNRLNGSDRPPDGVYDELADLKLLLIDIQAGGGGTNRCLHNAGVHASLPADNLHTVLKGPVQDAITWVMECLYYLQAINPDVYGNIVSSINEIMQNFPRNQTYNPFGKIPELPTGISYWFPENRAFNKGNSSGMACSLSASRLPGIAFLLIFAIGENNNIVPKKVNLTGGDRRLREHDNWNVERVCTNALISCLDVVEYCSKSDGFIPSEYVKLDLKVANMRAHMTRLFNLKADLRRCFKRQDISTGPRKVSKAIKSHLLEHLSYWIRRYGPIKVFDTQRSEKKHMSFKALFEMSSKNTSSMSEEMCKRLSLQHRILLLGKRYDYEVQKHKRCTSENPTSSQPTVSTESKSIPTSSQPTVSTESSSHRLLYLFAYSIDCAKDSLVFRSTNERDGCYIVDTTAKAYLLRLGQREIVERNVERNVKEVSQYIHPFLSMQSFSDILYTNASDDLIYMLSYFNAKGQHSGIGLEVLSHITCEGNKEIGVEPFVIKCNQRVHKNKKNSISNHRDIATYSHLVIRWNDDQTDSVVKVMAIVHLKSIQTKLERKQDWRQLGRVVLLVAKMDIHKQTTANCLPYDKLSYTFTQEKRSTYNQEFDVIELESIRKPVCVIPVYSNIQTATKKECYNDRAGGTRQARHFRFYMVNYKNDFVDEVSVNHYVDEDCDRVDEPLATSTSGLPCAQANVNRFVLDSRALAALNSDVSGKEIAESNDSDYGSGESADGYEEIDMDNYDSG